MKLGFLIYPENLIQFDIDLINAITTELNFDFYFIIVEERKLKNKKLDLWKRQTILALFLKLDFTLFNTKINPFKKVNYDFNKNDKLIYVRNNSLKENIITLNNEDITILKSYDFDLLYRINWGIIRGEVCNIAKYGIWSIHHGDNDYYRGKPALFWEYYFREKTAGAILQKLTETLDGGILLDKLIIRLDPFSLSKSYYNLYYKSVQMVVNNMVYLEKYNEIKKNRFDQNLFFGKPIYKNPHIFNQIILIFKMFFSNFKRIKNIFIKARTWKIYLANSKSKFLIYKYKKINNRPGFFSADPFIFTHQNESIVFFEEASLTSKKGHISFFNAKNPEEKKICLTESFHLSFPNVFSVDNNIYMLPETRSINCICLYKCVNFPGEWVFYKKILDNCSAVDTDILHHNGVYYLFTCINNNPFLLDADCLSIYTSPNFDGPYEAHKMNPISRNVKSGRLGGKVFKHNNALYRVAQNQIDGYGSGLSLYKILSLTLEDYDEILVHEIDSGIFESKGLHTLNFNENFSVVDILN